MARAQQTASNKIVDPKSKTIDHIAEILKELRKDTKYKVNAELATDQWNSTLEEMKKLRSKEEIKSSEKKGEREQEKGTRKSSGKKMEREQEKDMRISSLEQQVKELTLRLSAIAGNRMADANSDITDLSDQYRPTKLAEMFKEVYNEEWTDAFQYYDTLVKGEDKVLDNLASIPKDIYAFCRDLFNQQSDNLERHMQHMLSIMKDPVFRVDEYNTVTTKKEHSARDESKEAEQETRILIKNFQKSMAKESTSNLFKLYRDVSSFKKKPEWMKDVASSEALKKFTSKLLELIWLMMFQDPPIVLKWLAPGSNTDKTSFAFYTKSGDIVQRTVWPAIYLSETGPLIAKGVVQTK